MGVRAQSSGFYLFFFFLPEPPGAPSVLTKKKSRQQSSPPPPPPPPISSTPKEKTLDYVIFNAPALIIIFFYLWFVNQFSFSLLTFQVEQNVTELIKAA